MGEAIISRGSAGAGGSGGGTKTLKTEIITENGYWVAPKAVDNIFHVRIFGGGGAGNAGYGGCGGYMNNSNLTIQEGISVYVTIGAGGKGGSYTSLENREGGTTAFGTYLSANGGVRGAGGSGGACVGYNVNVANFGGGSGWYHYENPKSSGFDGGTWGGGGGTFYMYGGSTGGDLNRRGGKGGSYGGNGGNVNINTSSININNTRNGNTGINTVSNNNIFDGGNYVNINQDMSQGNLRGYGKGGIGTVSTTSKIAGSGGGGGFGGNGGSYCGGGGGYGANGGNYFGGGGGYGGDGGDGCNVLRNNNYGYGGGGGYGPLGKGGSWNSIDGGIAAGGAYYNNNYGNGGNGICIIQYYAID